MFGITKGNNGYIRCKKLFQSVFLATIVLVSLTLFLIGFKTAGTTRNLLTVFAVLGVLPGAKALVNLVLFLPYRSWDEDHFKEILGVIGENGHLYSDLVFTSSKHVMHLDSLYVNGNEIIGLTEAGSGSKKSDKLDEISEYFTGTMKKQGVGVHMHIFTEYSKYRDRVESLSAGNEDIPQQLEEFIRTVLV